jgi:8-oxo-dGTP pyrophosphatase MutT (NUDIX family)
MSQPEIFAVERLNLRLTPKAWAFAAERRAEINKFFAALKKDKPAVWNGRVLLLHHQVVSGGVFTGEFLETDYASFAAWSAWGRPPAGVRDCFGAAALVARDGALLLGVMGAHTYNAGQIYLPCGTPDPADIIGGAVDLEGNVRRELKEETGLDAGELTAEPGWITVVDGSWIMHVKVLRAREGATALRTRILDFLSGQRQPELADVRIVGGPADFEPAMPRFVTAFLERHFKARLGVQEKP